MYLKCLDEYRAKVAGARVVFEETTKFGYAYEVDEKVGNKLLATGRFSPCTDEEAKKLEVLVIVPAAPAPAAEPATAPEVEPELSPAPEPEAEPELTSEPEAEPGPKPVEE